jgi:hypothetical protein
MRILNRFVAERYHEGSGSQRFDAARAEPIHFLAVIRVFTMLAALAALAASGPVSMLHVHAYEGHDHPDHHHGPAAHSHDEADHDRHRDESPGATSIHLESCDPGEHAVPVVFTCVSPIAHQAPLADGAVAVLIVAPDVASCCATLSDVRAHSPPRLTDAPLRAPPVVHAA